MSYVIFARSQLGDVEDYDPLFAGCHYDEVLDVESGQCERHYCPGDEAPYYGACLPLNVQEEMAKLRCDETQQWRGPGYASCRCKPGYVKAPDSWDTLCMKPPVTGEPVIEDLDEDEQPWPAPRDSASVASVSTNLPWWMFAGAGLLLLGAASYYSRG